MHETKKPRTVPDNGKIIKEMADIAFSPEEKTADRLRALNLLSEALSESEKTDEALKRLDEILSYL